MLSQRTTSVACCPATRAPGPMSRHRSGQAHVIISARLEASACSQPADCLVVAAAGWASALSAAAALILAPQANAADAPAIFEKSCVGCHSGGGNIIRRDATLQLDDLKKYGLANPDGLYAIIYSGRNSMPGFGQDCAPRGACTFGPRLPDADIEALAAYVLSSAQDGWQQ